MPACTFFIAYRVRDRDDAQDLTAKVFPQAPDSIQRFEWQGAPFAAWLLGIARWTGEAPNHAPLPFVFSVTPGIGGENLSRSPITLNSSLRLEVRLDLDSASTM